MKEEESPAMARGSEVHTLADYYVKYDLKIPEPLKGFSKEFRKLRELNKTLSTFFTERQFALTKEWKPTGWFDRDVYVRFIVDVGYINKGRADIIDHKTGKIYETNEDQMELFAATFYHYHKRREKIEEVSTHLWYLDFPEDPRRIVTRKYDPADLEKSTKAWDKRAQPMLKDKTFAPRPGNYCRWCSFSASKGGPCKY
jgi:hypothetical protein